MTDIKLKAPFPYFGGKSRVAALVWEQLGDVDNYIEPFCGSAAVLLARPAAPKIETLNDADCFVANFWRATTQAPDAVAFFADGPVNEADLHARHRWLVLSDGAKRFRERVRTDPEYFDAKVAGWWCWGLCCWIGSGWCQTPESAEWAHLPDITTARSLGKGVNGGGLPQKAPNITGRSAADVEKGVNRGPTADQAKRPRVASSVGGYMPGVINLLGPSDVPSQVPGQRKGALGGVHSVLSDAHRPQLADAFARGRGVHGHDLAETCAARRAWLVDWFGRLRDRLRTVRVCCGDWRRVCDSHSVTTRLGVTGVFFDPPYSAEAGRCNTLYGVESATVAHDVRAYCLDRGPDPLMRVVLAGYAGEGHEELEANGWSVVAWKAAGGYGNRSAKGKDNAGRERLWVSPHCAPADELPLFRGDS